MNRTVIQRILVVFLFVLGVVLFTNRISSCRTSNVKAAAGQLFVQMQNEDVAGTLRGQPAQDMADQIEKTLKQHDLYLDAIYVNSETLGILIQRGWERDAWEAQGKLRSTHGNPDEALSITTKFEMYQRRSGKSLGYFYTSRQDLDDKQVWRNHVEKAINDKLHVSAADCIRAGIPIPTKTVIRRMPAKPKPPAVKTPTAKKSSTKPPAHRPALRAR